MPYHVPQIDGRDPFGVAFAYFYGYIQTLIDALVRQRSGASAWSVAVLDFEKLSCAVRSDPYRRPRFYLRIFHFGPDMPRRYISQAPRMVADG